MAGGHNQSQMIQIFLWCMAAIYLSAFTSLYRQIPGLYGENGIYPAAFVLEDNSVCADFDQRCKMWYEDGQCKINPWMLDNCAKSCNSCLAGFQKFLHQPTLLWVTPKLGLTTETGMEFLCLVGMILSFLMLFSQGRRDVISFTILWYLYYSLKQVGQVFLYYQWDSLLLEAGFLTILIAPWNLFIGFCRIIRCKRFNPIGRKHNGVTFWLAKWLLFRLMFQSGVVKFQWRDETWWNLTALNWHYESQCIPNPIAWYMHKLPTSFHRFSVVITYLIEIGTPILFFAPLRGLRMFAFISQVLLQAMIISTGNYNFFNLLTITLCISLLDDKCLQWNLKWCRASLESLRICSWRQKNEQGEVESAMLQSENRTEQQRKPPNPIHKGQDFREEIAPAYEEKSAWALVFETFIYLFEAKLFRKRFLVFRNKMNNEGFKITVKVLRATIVFSVILVFFDVTAKLFGMRFSKKEVIHVATAFTYDQFSHALTTLMPYTIVIGLLSLSVEIKAALIRCVLNKYSIATKIVAILQTILFSAIAFWMFGLSLVPYTVLDAKARYKIPPYIQKQEKRTEHLELFNSYGLFRSMTGVGGRPEVVIMGGNSLDENATWKEYNFMYKPGNLYSVPPFNVPHQPRLDWQMWFAALEDFLSNPWFIHLTYKLLHNEQYVIDLIGHQPFPDKPPKYIRSVLFTYHYTLNNTGFGEAIARHEKKWWTRDYVKEYMPAVSKNDRGLLRLLNRFGLLRKHRQPQKHRGVIHSLMLSVRNLTRPFKAETLIYLLFTVFLAVTGVRFWWTHHGIVFSKPSITRTERIIRNKLNGYSDRFQNVISDTFPVIRMRKKEDEWENKSNEKAQD